MSDLKKRSRKLKDVREVETAAIVAEMKNLGIGKSDLSTVFNSGGSPDAFVEVPPIRVFPLARELNWTGNQPDFEQARQSAIDAIMQILAETRALSCSFNAESPNIEQTLHQIRAGMIGGDDSRITELVSYAQNIGKGREIHRRIDYA